MNHRITKTVAVEMDLTPEQCAQMFALSDTRFQAAFINELGRLSACEGEADGLAAAWWERQCLAITGDDDVPEISHQAKYALTTLQDFICNEPEAAQ